MHNVVSSCTMGLIMGLKTFWRGIWISIYLLYLRFHEIFFKIVGYIECIKNFKRLEIQFKWDFLNSLTLLCSALSVPLCVEIISELAFWCLFTCLFLQNIFKRRRNILWNRKCIKMIMIFQKRFHPTVSALSRLLQPAISGRKTEFLNTETDTLKSLTIAIL